MRAHQLEETKDAEEKKIITDNLVIVLNCYISYMYWFFQLSTKSQSELSKKYN